MEENLAQLGEKSCAVSKTEMLKYSDKLVHAQEGKLYGSGRHEDVRFRLAFICWIHIRTPTQQVPVCSHQTDRDVYVQNKSIEASDIYDWLANPCGSNHGINLK